MSKRKTRVPCGKRILRNRIAVARHMIRLPIRKGRDEIRAYWCPRCRGWHTTSRL